MAQKPIMSRSLNVQNLAKQFSILSIQKSDNFLATSNQQQRNYSMVLQNPNLLSIAMNINKNQSRTVTKFSLNKGKRKSVKAALKRFFRLHWGGWIRTHSGRHKKMWKKSGSLKRRLRQHVFVNSTQAWMLDKMVTKFWRRPKYYVDDPYTPYHTRNEYYATKSKPRSYIE
jgi:large subunit ribosomal protein L35